MKPLTHAKNSVKKYGGTVDEYLVIHNFIDQTKAYIPDMRHRAIYHNAFGIYQCEMFLGVYIVNRDLIKVSVRDVAEDHVLEDLGRIPTLEECLKDLPLNDLLGARLRKIKSITLIPTEKID